MRMQLSLVVWIDKGENIQKMPLQSIKPNRLAWCHNISNST